jgi:N-acetylglucosamine kinase-like BadF-type ATPase
MTPANKVVIAVDGGGSKTDVVALALDGTVIARKRGPKSSPHLVGLEGSVAVIDALVRDVVGDAEVVQADVYLSGLDLPIEIERYRAGVAGCAWAGAGLVVDNDLFALLRAGTEATDAVAVICGTGINAVGIRADGATVRFPALGEISGDWGGGYGLGQAALWHAARAVDGRGPQTALVEGVLTSLGAHSIDEVIEQLHFGQREFSDLSSLAPVVLAAAARDDAIALSLVDRQAEEIVAFVRAIVTRLGLGDHAFPVVLGGGMFETETPRLSGGVLAGVAEVAPRAKVVHVRRPPIAGAALLALEHAGVQAQAIAVADAAFAGTATSAVAPV